MTRAVNLEGARCGALVAVSRAGKSEGGKVVWIARCDCGNTIEIRSNNFGKTRSCGCLTKQLISAATTKHGLARKGHRHSEYYIWFGMTRRCRDVEGYPRYAGRGISVCPRWIIGDGSLTGFECFIADMGPRPSKKHSLDRYPDNDGNYEPSNCRWATSAEQCRNTSVNRHVFFRGSRMILIDAIRLSGLTKSSVLARIRMGWTEERALNVPLRLSKAPMPEDV